MWYIQVVQWALTFSLSRRKKWLVKKKCTKRRQPFDNMRQVGLIVSAVNHFYSQTNELNLMLIQQNEVFQWSHGLRVFSRSTVRKSRALPTSKNKTKSSSAFCLLSAHRSEWMSELFLFLDRKHGTLKSTRHNSTELSANLLPIGSERKLL